ncbi:MAG: hypothetical protein NVS1B2_15920 [Vulcanimicrobiaceae bacterium]
MIDRAIIACVPVADAPSDYPNKHYEQRPCPRCGRGMYIGPNSLATHERDKTPIACMRCVIRDYGSDAFTTIRSLGGP